MYEFYRLFTLLFLLPGYLSLGYSTPFLSLGVSYMYSSLAAAKAAVISVGEEIETQGLPAGICPLVFVFTGSGKGIVTLHTTLLVIFIVVNKFYIIELKNLIS